MTYSDEGLAVGRRRGRKRRATSPDAFHVGAPGQASPDAYSQTENRYGYMSQTK